MDKNRIKGAAKKVEGAAQEIAGKITGDETQKVAGKLKKAEASVQAAFGKAKDRMKKD